MDCLRKIEFKEIQARCTIDQRQEKTIADVGYLLTNKKNTDWNVSIFYIRNYGLTKG
jgi:hypothetical protein